MTTYSIRPPGRSMLALNEHGRAVSLILGLKVRTIQSRLHAGAPLVRSGLVSIDDNDDLAIQCRLRRLATAPGNGNIDITRLLLDVAPPAEVACRVETTGVVAVPLPWLMFTLVVPGFHD